MRRKFKAGWTALTLANLAAGAPFVQAERRPHRHWIVAAPERVTSEKCVALANDRAPVRSTAWVFPLSH